MSVESDSGQEGSTKRQTSLTSTKDKMKVQQRMIDLTARELESTRLAMTPVTESGGTALEENNLLIENKLMKLFARQLMHKHQYLEDINLDLSNDSVAVEKMAVELDSLISFEMFLNIAGLGQRTIKALLSDTECFSVDSMFFLSHIELQKLFARHDIPSTDCLKLVGLLDLLSHYYEKWEKGEKPTTGVYDIRRNSSSGRLNSLNSIASIDSHKDLYSSHTISPPGAQYYSRSSTPLTPVTPSSTNSPCPGLPHQTSTPVFPMPSDVSPSFKRSNSSNNTSYQAVVLEQQHLSSSSSSLSSDLTTHHMYTQQVEVSSYVPPPSASKTKCKLGHKRSHSNPPLANIIMPEVVPENSVPEYRSPSPPYHTLPTRAGSHSSIVQNTVINSPSAKSHPQMRRIMGTFARSISTDLGGGDIPSPPEPPIRSNSEASGVQGSSPRQRRLSKETGTSASMVDLPLIRCSGDKLDYSFPTGGKSHSVPRLANLIVNGDSGHINQSVSVPTSPRLTTNYNYNPTGVIGHNIDHRFVGNLFFGVHECDYCKKTLVMNGAKCRYCKYKCHKTCSKLAPPTCGLPRDFLNYARRNKHLLLTHPHESVLQVQIPSGNAKQRNFSTSVEYIVPPSSPRVDEETFLIQDLNREPTNSQYSPVINRHRYLGQTQIHSPSHENGHVFGNQTSSSRLEVPHLIQPSPLHTHHHPHHHSTSSTPSTSSHSSPCLTPVSPHSPLEHLNMDYSYPSGYVSVSSVPVIFTDDSMEEEDESQDERQFIRETVRLHSEDSQAFSSCSSENSSINDISAEIRVNGSITRGLRPPPQVVSAQSLPNLLLAEQNQHIPNNIDSTGNDMYTSSENNLQSWFTKRKDSLVNTLSTADSKTSTLVESTIEEDDDTSSFAGSDLFSSQGEADFRQRIGPRHSMVDEWIIPYEDLRIVEKIGSGPVAKVYKGYWHGEVAIKRFYMPDATDEQIMRFKEEIAVLKKTRHENLALFMGACLTPPNLAIVTSLCKGYTLYKLLHHWSEVFSLERLVNVGRQIALAMGYLHARGIIHKGLNTKNIFIEKTTDNKEKIVITDMGLSALSSCIWSSDNESMLMFPRTQLYYLAPEIMRCIASYHVCHVLNDPYPFTEHTDIYAFGTVLYEMITRKFPFVMDPLGFAYEHEAVIFMVGKGRRQEFKTTDIPKKLKELVWVCWNPEPTDRPAFSELREKLSRLCRKHTPITRSPSHPINLSKSVDNLLFI